MRGRPRDPLYLEIVEVVNRIGARVPTTPEAIYGKCDHATGSRRFEQQLAKAVKTGAIERVGNAGDYKYRPAKPRWALTSDGAFMLVGTTTEIPPHAARELVAFVRTLDKGEA